MSIIRAFLPVILFALLLAVIAFLGFAYYFSFAWA